MNNNISEVENLLNDMLEVALDNQQLNPQQLHIAQDIIQSGVGVIRQRLNTKELLERITGSEVQNDSKRA